MTEAEQKVPFEDLSSESLSIVFQLFFPKLDYYRTVLQLGITGRHLQDRYNAAMRTDSEGRYYDLNNILFRELNIICEKRRAFLMRCLDNWIPKGIDRRFITSNPVYNITVED